MKTILLCCILSAILFPTTEGKRLVNLGHQRGYFQGDLLIKPSNTRNGILKAARWPNGVIPYIYGSNWPQENIDMIKEAMEAIQNSTCIRFVARTDEADYIKITNTTGGCYTFPGRIGGAQMVSLHDGPHSSCFSHSTIVHELMHVCGLWHEQSRYDRDDYITIHYENMDNSTQMKAQFEIVTQDKSSTYGIPYNYLSVMHYTADSGSINGEWVMETKDPKYRTVIGTVAYGHELDFEKIRRIYECQGRYTPAMTTEAPCEDEHNACEDYADKCEKATWMRHACRQTCGFCSPGQSTKPGSVKPCVDEFPNCDYYMDKCGVESWMRSGCRKSCKFCTPQADDGAATTPTPVPTQRPTPGTGPCQDMVDYCKDYMNECNRQAWTQRGCAKTCGFC